MKDFADAHPKPDFDYLMENGFDFEPTRYIREGWAIVQKNIGIFVVFTLALLIIIGIIETMLPDSLGVLLGLAYPVFYAGYYFVADKLEQGEKAEVADFFTGVREMPTPLLLVGVLMTVLILVGFLLLIIPGVYLAVAYAFAIPILIFGGKEGWDALETSRKIISKNWFGVFTLVILLALVNLAGIIPLGLGLLITIPITYCAIYSAYRHVMEQSVSHADIPMAEDIDVAVEVAEEPGSEDDSPGRNRFE